MNAKKLAIDAMLAAMCAALGYLAIDLTAVKVTFESLPVLVGALMFGPVHGMAIGAVGTFLYQILRYGFSYTTVLWMLPYILCGLVAGLYAKAKHYDLPQRGTLVVVLICELMITALNTGVIYIDSKIYGYYTPQLILGALAARIMIAVAKGILFGLVIPEIIKGVRTVVKPGEK